MTELIIQSSSSRNGPCESVYRMGGGGGGNSSGGGSGGCRSPIIGRYTGCDRLDFTQLKHSKSDDLVLQSAPLSPPEIQHGISEASLQIQREACVVYEEDLAPPPLPPPSSSSSPQTASNACHPVYFSDSETSSTKRSSLTQQQQPPPLKITGDFGPDVMVATSSKRSSQYIFDRIDPEDSIKDIISENDFYRYVLFKRHYERYLDIAKRYEEARSIAYYLEEKYHEIKAERDNLASLNQELEKTLVEKDTEMHEKEDELFLQLEKAIRLEEDYEKLKVEKERISEWTDRLEREKNEAYRQLKLQADESEMTRRRLERARSDVVRQVTAIVAEKDSLEKENARLKDALRDIEHKSYSRRFSRNVAGLEKEVSDLKMVAKQSATLNSQLKKGMKHLASCRRRKCSVCAYTRATFGEYTNTRGAKLLSCFNGGGVGVNGGANFTYERRMKSTNFQHDDERRLDGVGGCGGSPFGSATPELSLRLSHLSLSKPNPNMSYIDECSSDSDTDVEPRYPPSERSSSHAPHAFSSDSGFSSEICDPATYTPTKSLTRATRWTCSFRKLIKKVSKKQQQQQQQQSTT